MATKAHVMANLMLDRLAAVPRARRWAVTLAWMGVIFIASAQSKSGEQSGYLVRLLAGLLGLQPTPEQAVYWHFALRKAAHFTEYAILGLFMAWALPSGTRRWVLAWGLSTAYAASDELHQAFVPNRGPAVADVAVDSLGAGTAALVARAIATARARRTPQAPAEPTEAAS